MSHTLGTSGDHPRVCGEHCELWSEGASPWGSSPRMRGTLVSSKYDAGTHGIIPAYAGNTDCNGWAGKHVWDHPRVCGEHPSIAWAISISPGSSPRMRGTRHVSSRRVVRMGIIPAYAGNTFCGASNHMQSRDHPRVCGEHIHRLHLERAYIGSSPRMRGTRAV